MASCKSRWREGAFPSDDEEEEEEEDDDVDSEDEA
jgi:hypothetical protein